MSELAASIGLRSIPRPLNLTGRWPYLVVGLVVLLVTLGLGLAVMSTNPKVSPIDEMQHLDSSIAASNGTLYLSPGTRIQAETMRLISCHGYNGTYQRKQGPPPCNATTFNPADYPQRGINTAAGRVNIFYPVVGYAAKVISAVTGVDFLVAGRAVCVFCWALGAALLALIASRLSRSFLIGAGAGLAVGLLGSGMWVAVTINPDSWSLLVGSLVVGAALAMPRWSPWQVGVATFGLLLLATLVKANFFVLAAIPFLLVTPWYFDPQRRRKALAVLAACVVSGIAFIYFSLPKGSTSASDLAPMADDLKISAKNPWDFTEMFGGILGGFVPIRPGSVVSVLANPFVSSAVVVTIAIMFAGVVVGLFSAQVRSMQFQWAAVTAVTAIAAPVLAYLGMIAIGVYFRYPERYSLIVLPAVAIAWVQLQPRRPALYLVTGLVGFCAVAWSVSRALT